MRCSRVRPRSVATRRRSTTPRSRSLIACGVAPKLGFLSRLRTSDRPGPAPRGEPGSHSPLPTPVGHAGLRSTSSSLPQAVSRNAAPSSKATHTTRRKHEKQKSCRTPSFYDANRNADVTYPQRAPKNGAQKRASVKPLWRAFPVATCTGLLMLWQLVSLGIQPREWADLLDLSPFDQCSVGALQPPGPVLVVESPPYVGVMDDIVSHPGTEDEVGARCLRTVYDLVGIAGASRPAGRVSSTQRMGAVVLDHGRRPREHVEELVRLLVPVPLRGARPGLQRLDVGAKLGQPASLRIIQPFLGLVIRRWRVFSDDHLYPPKVCRVHMRTQPCILQGTHVMGRLPLCTPRYSPTRPTHLFRWSCLHHRRQENHVIEDQELPEVGKPQNSVFGPSVSGRLDGATQHALISRPPPPLGARQDPPPGHPARLPRDQYATFG